MTLKDKLLKPFEGKAVYEKLRLFYWKIRNKKQQQEVEKNAQARAEGRLDEKYLKLKELKDSHKGERCFIIATGPSLTIEDLEKLSDETTFGMNSIKRLYDKTSWRPTYYGIQDRDVYKAMEDVIKATKDDEQMTFVADKLFENFDVPSEFVVFPYDGEYHLYTGKLGKLNAKFSDDAYSIVYDGYSITYSLIQIAVYMGFKEIYLLGCDCSWGNGKNHVVESGFYDKRAISMGTLRLNTSLQVAYDWTKDKDVTIYNATRGGELEIFERVDLDKILEK